MVEKIYGDKSKSRAGCTVREIESNNYYYNVELDCTTDINFILQSEGAKISTNYTGHSGFVIFTFNNELKEKIICEGEEPEEPVETSPTTEPSDTTHSGSNNITYNNIRKLLVLISLFLL